VTKWGAAFALCAVLVATCAKRDEYRANGQYEERCRARGGYWLDDSIRVDSVLTRCIAAPTPIILTQPEKPR